MVDKRYETGSTDFFLKLMRKKLKENSHKGSWINEEVWTLYYRLVEEVAELGKALATGETVEAVWLEAADVGNLAMMVADSNDSLRVI